MPYIINKTNGTVITTVLDASVDQTTDLTFVGRNYAGYGEVQNENFLKLLENFSNTTPPTNPILGQLWYDTGNKNLNVCYAEASGNNSAKFKPLATSNSGNATPSDSVTGDLWYDSANGQLKVWNGSSYIVIGPVTGSDIKAQWRGDFEYDTLAPDLPVYNVKAVIGADNEVVAIVSAETYTMPDYSEVTTAPGYPARTTNFTKIVRGITLEGADPNSGSTRKEVTGLSTSSYFWGTAAESLYSLYSGAAGSTNGISAQTTTTNQQFYVTFINTATSTAYVDEGIKYNPATNTLYTIASSALYADLAERYEADAVYEPGTVLVIGGDKEVTISTFASDPAVAGIVSKNPAYMMNSEAGTDETHPYIALKGRVLCKVYGFINKGDLLITSDYPGHACASITSSDSPHAIIGKALEGHLQGFGVIEVKV
jgi:hypothetical protein